MTQGKFERYHRSLKNVVKLQTYHFPWQLEQEIDGFAGYYNNRCYQEALNNVTPADIYLGRHHAVLSARDKNKQRTLQRRRSQNLKPLAA